MKEQYNILKAVKCGASTRWAIVRRSNGEPYVFDTEEEAVEASRLCYDADPTTVRIQPLIKD